MTDIEQQLQGLEERLIRLASDFNYISGEHIDFRRDVDLTLYMLSKTISMSPKDVDKRIQVVSCQIMIIEYALEEIQKRHIHAQEIREMTKSHNSGDDILHC